MVLSPNDEEVANSSKKHTQFKTRRHKPYPVSDQKWLKLIPYFKPKGLKRNFWRGTYLYSLTSRHVTSLGICVSLSCLVTRDMCFLGLKHISLGICVSLVGEHISLGIFVCLVRGTHITRDMCFPGWGTHITRDMCFLGRETPITRDMCFPGRGTHITRDMCFPGRGTHITRDMCFPGRN